MWGTQSQAMPLFVNDVNYSVGGVIINSTQLLVLALAIVIMLILMVFVNKTKLGMAMRAVALDQSTCGLMGVNVNFIIALTFAVGSMLGAVSGIMMSSYYGVVYPTMGDLVGTKGFAAVVLGGAGSIPGAVVGGLLIGVIECLAGSLISAQAKEMTAFLVLILVLLVKPSGLLGKDVVKE